MVAGSESWELSVSYLAFLFPQVPKAADLSHPRYPQLPYGLRNDFLLQPPTCPIVFHNVTLTLGIYLSYCLPQRHSHSRYLPCPIVFHNVTLTLGIYLSYCLPQRHSHAKNLPCHIVFHNVILTLGAYLSDRLPQGDTHSRYLPVLLSSTTSLSR